MSLKTDLKSHITGEVYDDNASLDTASRDASLFEIKPQLVIAPKDAKDIGALISYCSEHPEQKLSLTARSAGTDMSGGPLTTSLVLDMKPHFHSVLQIGPDFAITQPGVYYRDFEKQTLKHDLLMPSYPASRELCTVGGMTANNSGGEKTLAYGKTANYVQELTVVLRDGKEHAFFPLDKVALEHKLAESGLEGDIYRHMYELLEKNYDLIQAAKPKVTKNSAGYALWNVWNKRIFDLTQLFVGSQGTLGIITKIKFKLIHPKPYSRMLVIFLNDVKPLANIVTTVLPFKPESFESYDDHTLKLAIRFFPEIAKRLKAKSLFTLAPEFLPEILAVLRLGRLPKLVLMAEFTGDTVGEVNRITRRAQESLKRFHLQTVITHNRQEGQKYWIVRRESFNLLRHHIRSKHTAPFIDDIVVQAGDLPQFLPELEQVMAQYKLTYTIAGHVGDGNFHIIPLMNLADPKTKEIIPKLSQQVYDLVLRYHGSITGEHNDGLIRTPFLRQMYGDQVFSLFQATKKVFDPNNIFNPGKKVGSTLDYALDHFIDDSHAS